MATSPSDLALRRMLLVLRAGAARDALKLWPALNPRDVDGTYPAWYAAATTLIARDRVTANAITADYLNKAWVAAGLAGSPAIVAAEGVPAERARTALWVTSIAAYRTAIRAGMSPAEASRSALVQSTGAVTRLVLNASRDTVLESAAANKARWRRLTSPGACEFCTMLSGRGAVYHTEATSGFSAHDHCACTAVIDLTVLVAAA